MKTNRPPLPEQLKRKVRQSCGFGCVICGSPIYDIDHIIEYSVVKEHTEDNLVLLCPTHHRKKKWMPIEDLRAKRRNPINLETGTSQPYFFSMISDSIDIYLGYNQYSKVFTDGNNFDFPIVVENLPLISLKKKENRLLISLTIFDEDDKPIMVIVDNEIIFSVSIWDIAIVGTLLTLFSCEKKKLIQLKFDIENATLSFLCGNFYFKKWNIEITSDGYFSLIHPTKSNQKIIGLTLGGESKIKSWMVIVNDEQQINVGFLIGDCPDFDDYGCLIKLG